MLPNFFFEESKESEDVGQEYEDANEESEECWYY
jgi:hypothetical protein